MRSLAGGSRIGFNQPAGLSGLGRTSESEPSTQRVCDRGLWRKAIVHQDPRLRPTCPLMQIKISTLLSYLQNDRRFEKSLDPNADVPIKVCSHWHH